MTNTEPVVEQHAKYELREAAKALDVSKSCIIKWTAKGFLKSGRKKVNGRQFWTGAELLRAWRARL